jgi:hypothetical protein
MQSGDYFATIKYEAPPPPDPSRKRKVIIILVIIVGVLILAGLGGAGVLKFLKQKEQSMQAEAAKVEGMPPAAVLTGQARKWRTLASFERATGEGQPRPGLAFGQFSKSGGRQALLIDFINDVKVISADGKAKRVHRGAWLAMAAFLGWDFDGNGVDELVPNTLFFTYEPKVEAFVRIGDDSKGGGDASGWISSTTEGLSETERKTKLVSRDRFTPLLDLQGKTAVQLGDGDDDGDILTGDFNGDGVEDLIVEVQRLAQSFKVYGRMGAPLTEVMLQAKLNHAVMADIDGDGKDELCNIEGPYLAVYHSKSERTELKSWPRGWFPSAACDLNGDGCDELLCAHSELVVGDLYNALALDCSLMIQGNAPDSEIAYWVCHNWLLATSHGLTIPVSATQLEEWVNSPPDEKSPDRAEYETMLSAIHGWVEEQAKEQVYKGLHNGFTPAELMVWVYNNAGPVGGIFDPHSGKKVDFQFPQSNYRFNIYQGDRGEIITPDCNHDGKPEIYVKASLGTHLLQFGADGQLLYDEEFEQPVVGMGVLRQAGREYLAVQLDQKLVAYP